MVIKLFLNSSDDRRYMLVCSSVTHHNTSLCDSHGLLFQKFAEDEAEEGSELYRTRAAVAMIIKCIAYRVSQIPKSHPSRAENERLDMQLDEIAEVANEYLQGKSVSSLYFKTSTRHDTCGFVDRMHEQMRSSANLR